MEIVLVLSEPVNRAKGKGECGEIDVCEMCVS